MFINKSLRLNSSKTKIGMNAKLSIFVICVEAIIYFLLHNLHDFTFNIEHVSQENTCALEFIFNRGRNKMEK